MLPKGAVRIQPLLFEKGDVAVYVSGMQGQMCITSSEEVLDPMTGKSKVMPVYTLAALATLRDIWLKEAPLES